MAAPSEEFPVGADFDLDLRSLAEPPSQLSLQMLYDAMGQCSGQPGWTAEGLPGGILMVEACRFTVPTHYPNGDMHAGIVTTHELDDEVGIATRRHEVWWLVGRGYELRPVDPPPRWLGYTDFDVQQMVRHLTKAV